MVDKSESCLTGKMTNKPFSGKGKRSQELLGLIHFDVYSLKSILDRRRAQYFVTIVDDKFRFSYVYLIKYQSEGF